MRENEIVDRLLTSLVVRTDNCVDSLGRGQINIYFDKKDYAKIMYFL
jgi:hypothetical protein